MSARRIVHFVLHVPKCAGMTIESHFAALLGPGYLHAPRWRSPLRLFLGEGRALRPGDPRLAGVRVVSGHSLSLGMKSAFAGAVIRESVLLREPVAFHVALFNERFRQGCITRADPAAFARWYERQRRNPVSRFLLWRYFERRLPALYALSSAARLGFLDARLARFWFVGDIALADRLVMAICRDLGLPAVRPERHNVSPSEALRPAMLPAGLVARIRADNRLDLALWQRWRGRGLGERGMEPADPAPALPRRDHLALALDDLRALAWRFRAHRGACARPARALPASRR